MEQIKIFSSNKRRKRIKRKELAEKKRMHISIYLGVHQRERHFLTKNSQTMLFYKDTFK